MSIFATVFADLNVDAVTSLCDDISPYVRGRGKDFPAVLYEVPTQNFDRISSGVFRVESSVEVSCYARSVVQAETLADAVITNVIDNTCNVIDSVNRDYEEGYDDDSVGLFSVPINYTNFNGG